ncbi:tripartite tricarboxylate transporter permease [Alteribacillus sp. YIM 98480]|uniref:tripartite tricarboxylate transporter permease n=1 Tax=Alteribacillus sp. YIM 98480 TaxID=2606599 RepID=UPI00131C64B0|nr:tripartite tricarboxylate transporter permease [Alteribacillus sp. YIM 98480]
MIDLQSLSEGISMLISFENFFLMIVGLTLGVILAAIPGFTGSLGIAIMLPLTFGMDPLPSLVFLLSIYTGGLYGGAITAILLNTPGSPAAVATSLDGYPMTKKGFAGRALGVAVGASSIGGFIGISVLLVIIQPLAGFALRFGPTEMFMVAVFGLTIIAALKGDSFVKTLYAGLLGILLGTIGMTSSGAIRGTFGSSELLDGIPIIPALIGLFAVSELFFLVDKGYVAKQQINRRNSLEVMDGVKRAFKYPGNILRSSTIGVFIGALPAAGSTIASLVSYNEAKRASKDPSSFGKGNEEGVVAGEAANNSSEGGALATMLVLGIPGSASAAMLLGAIIMQGWTPGPRLFIDHSDVLYGVIFSELIQEILLVVIGGAFAIIAGRIVQVPTRVLIPTIIVFALIGSFAVRNLMFDAMLVFLFGLLGWYLRKNAYPTIAVVLGLILGPLADTELLRSHQLYGEETFAMFFQRPITLILIALTILGGITPFLMEKKKQKKG